MISWKIPKFPTTSLLLQVFLKNPIFSQKFSLVDSHFVHRPGKIFPVRDIFPVISQNIPKQDLNENPKRGNNDFPKNPKISQNFPPQVYFQETFSHIFPKNPKTGNQVFPNIPRFSHFGKYIPFCVRIPITGKLGKIAKMKLVRARPKLYSMVNIGK